MRTVLHQGGKPPFKKNAKKQISQEDNVLPQLFQTPSKALEESLDVLKKIPQPQDHLEIHSKEDKDCQIKRAPEEGCQTLTTFSLDKESDINLLKESSNKFFRVISHPESCQLYCVTAFPRPPKNSETIPYQEVTLRSYPQFKIQPQQINYLIISEMKEENQQGEVNTENKINGNGFNWENQDDSDHGNSNENYDGGDGGDDEIGNINRNNGNGRRVRSKKTKQKKKSGSPSGYTRKIRTKSFGRDAVEKDCHVAFAKQRVLHITQCYNITNIPIQSGLQQTNKTILTLDNWRVIAQNKELRRACLRQIPSIKDELIADIKQFQEQIRILEYGGQLEQYNTSKGWKNATKQQKIIHTKYKIRQTEYYLEIGLARIKGILKQKENRRLTSRWVDLEEN